MTYNFVGAVAEEYNLTGEENLGQIVQKFIERESALSRRNLPDIDKSIRNSIERKQKKIISEMQNLTTRIFLYAESEKVIYALDHLTRQYLLTEFSAKYDELDTRIFSLEREIDVDDEMIKIPLFFRSLIEEKETYMLQDVCVGSFLNASLEWKRKKHTCCKTLMKTMKIP
ncbi:hypothetical protein DRJ25_03100 [Candidatus Woesearchaeota archaeon]|nr:MAG: hypothetical protein DRJ25_03100 [Candidatus Woesearchaeota archaeon]